MFTRFWVERVEKELSDKKLSGRTLISVGTLIRLIFDFLERKRKQYLQLHESEYLAITKFKKRCHSNCFASIGIVVGYGINTSSLSR